MRNLDISTLTDLISKLWNPQKIDSRDNSWRYALAGVALGISAPVGWLIINLVIFGDWNLSLGDLIFQAIMGTDEKLALFIYMGGGTSGVIGTFGFLIGKAIYQIKLRAGSLDSLNTEIEEQKSIFENKFNELNNNLKNFQNLNAQIQNTIEVEEIVNLAAKSIKEVLLFDRVNIFMLNKEQRTLELKVCLGVDNLPDEQIVLPCDTRAGVIYQSFQEKKPILVTDMAQSPRSYRLEPPYDQIPNLRSKSFILCPITRNDQPIGIIGVDNRNRKKDLSQTDLDTIRLFADQISANLTKLSLLDAVEILTTELETTFIELVKYRGKYSDILKELQQGSSEMAETIVSITESASVIKGAVDNTSSASTEISFSVEEVETSIQKMKDFVETSVSAMTQISSTIDQVQSNATDALEITAKVQDQAKGGVDAVAESFGSMQGISTAVDQATRSIDRLSQRSDEIDRIIAVINEINQKTNLLSLNAAIIAAQAGDKGRSFGVVAEEIRNLSRETTESADAIEELIEDIQNATAEVVLSIGETRSLVDSGIDVGKKTDVALQEILESATRAMEMSNGIERATKEQASSTRYVTDSIGELEDMSNKISLTSHEQALGIKRIAESIEEIKNMADDMAVATAKHEERTEVIDSAVVEVGEMATTIFEELEQRKAQSHQVFEQLEQMRNLSDR